MKLTDEEIKAVHASLPVTYLHIEYARAIEAAVLEKQAKVDVEPCCANWKAGTNCFADPYPNCPHLKVDVEPVKLSPFEDFCYCDHEISLQIVSGGAAPEGLYGRVTLQVKGEYVDYVPASALAALRAENERLREALEVLLENGGDYTAKRDAAHAALGVKHD